MRLILDVDVNLDEAKMTEEAFEQNAISFFQELFAKSNTSGVKLNLQLLTREKNSAIIL